MTLALIAGMGALPVALLDRLETPPLVCALQGFKPDLNVDLPFRIEHLGSFLDELTKRNVTQICMAGAIRRPNIDPAEIDAATAPLVPGIAQAIAQGDDGALRIVIAIFEERGFAVRAAHEIAPDLLPASGVLTQTQPADWHKRDAIVGDMAIAAMGAADSGQAAVIRLGQVAATEGPDGTDAMIAQFHAPYLEPETDVLDAVFALPAQALDMATEWLGGDTEDPVTADDGILFKAPKPNQDLRADMPVIGVSTAMKAAEAGLAGIVIKAGGVMVLDVAGVIATLDAQKMFLWVRP